jgi:hypothetical protein
MRLGYADVRDCSIPAVAGSIIAALVAGCSAPAASAQVTPISTPPLLWSDVQQVGVYCLVNSARGTESELQGELCARIRDLAAEGSPTPVRVIPIADPAILEAGTVTMILQGTVHKNSDVAPGAPGEFIALSVRPFHNGGDAPFTGSSIQVAPLDAGADSPALAAALRSALDQVLPWRASTAVMTRPL